MLLLTAHICKMSISDARLAMATVTEELLALRMWEELVL